jgi:hypothetical protein
MQDGQCIRLCCRGAAIEFFCEAHGLFSCF